MKSHFDTPLLVEQVNDIDARLLADFVYYSERLAEYVVVPRGFVTDFASVPRLPFAYSLFGGVAKQAAVIHDYLYRTGSATRCDADAVFREAMDASGVSSWRRAFMWAGVRVFGSSSYKGKETDHEDIDDPFGDSRGA